MDEMERGRYVGNGPFSNSSSLSLSPLGTSIKVPLFDAPSLTCFRYSIRRLQMEQMAVMGKAEPSALVADRMRLIFTTLEAVDPRWGGLKDYPTL